MIWSLAADRTELRDGWLHVAKLCQKEHIDAGRTILKTLEETNQLVSWVLTLECRTLHSRDGIASILLSG